RTHNGHPLLRTQDPYKLGVHYSRVTSDLTHLERRRRTNEMVGKPTTRSHSSRQWLLRRHSRNPLLRTPQVRLLGTRQWSRSTKKQSRNQDSMSGSIVRFSVLNN